VDRDHGLLLVDPDYQHGARQGHSTHVIGDWYESVKSNADDKPHYDP